MMVKPLRSLPAFCLAAIASGTAPVIAQTAPVNLAPNSQWEIISGLDYGTRENIEGTGTLPPINISANTTGDNLVTLTFSGSLVQVKVGDLVKLEGAGLDSVLKIAPMRILAISGNTFTVRPALGAKPTRTGSGVAVPVNIGMSGSSNRGDAADGWKKSLNLVVWREDNYQNLPFNNPTVTPYYALGLNKDIASQEYVEIQLDATRFRGKTLAFGSNVYQKVRGGTQTWQVYIQSDSGSSQSARAAATTGYQWLETSYKVPDNATSLSAGVKLLGAAGDTYYLADPVLTVGNVIGAGNYIKPRETFIPVVHISPLSWINAQITFPSQADSRGVYTNSFDMYAETGGAVAPTVRHAFGQLEGINRGAVQVNTGAVRVIAFYDRPTAPDKSGSFLAQYVAGVKSFTPLDLTLDGAGRAVYSTGVSGDIWSNLAMEFDGFFLE